MSRVQISYKIAKYGKFIFSIFYYLFFYIYKFSWDAWMGFPCVFPTGISSPFCATLPVNKPSVWSEDQSCPEWARAVFIYLFLSLSIFISLILSRWLFLHHAWLDGIALLLGLFQPSLRIRCVSSA